MGGYVLKRVLFTIPTLIGISIVIFIMVRLLPGDIIDVLLGGDPTATEEVKQQAREQLGLTGSYPEQYWRWVSGILQGDFGFSLPQHPAGLGDHPQRAADHARARLPRAS